MIPTVVGSACSSALPINLQFDSIEMSSLRQQRGLSLVETMIGIALGLVVIAALTTIVSNTSRTRSELAKSNQQSENGRYALQILNLDLHHAGFFGDLYSPGLDATVSPPDPCLNASLTDVNSLQYPVQGMRVAVTSGSSNLWANCKSANNLAGTAVTIVPADKTEVLAIRRADRVAVCATGAIVSNNYYIQATSDSAIIQKGDASKFSFGTTTPAGGNSTLCKTASGDVTKLDPACRVHLTPNAEGLPCGTATTELIRKTAATIRKLHVNVYFVGDFNGVPTLQRLVLGQNGVFSVEPLVEGIENLQVEYGVDSVQTGTSFGIPDEYKTAANMVSPTDWQNVVAVRVHVLARNLQPSAGYSDTKTYTLGSLVSIPHDATPSTGQVKRSAEDDKYKRHVFSSTVSLYNPAGRRVLP